jgi:hypothetical protein
VKHLVLKPFHLDEAGRIVQRGEIVTLDDQVRSMDLCRQPDALLMVLPGESRSAPQNRNAAPQRRTK